MDSRREPTPTPPPAVPGLTLALLTLLTGLWAPRESTAQYPVAPNGFAVEASGGLVSFSDSINSFNFGGGGSVGLRYTVSGVQLSGVVGYSAVTVEDLEASRRVWSFSLDPRIMLKTTPGAAPYVGARIGYAMWSVDVGDLNLPGATEAESEGWVFAATFGALIPLAKKWALDARLVFGVGAFGDIELDDGTEISSTEENGAAGSFTVGIVYSFSY